MKVYTFYTDSHVQLMNIFLENFPYSNGIDLVVRKMPQECSTAVFMTEGWNSTMRRKVQYVIDALRETPENQWFVHADCDIVLFQEWETILHKYGREYDMLIQDDYATLCAGFFFCKNNELTRTLWSKVLETLDKFDHDQLAMNFWIRQIHKLKVGVLPNSYFTYGLFGKDTWEGTTKFEIPDVKNLKMFHANWTAGIQNKIELLKEAIKQKNDIRL
jgi:hypothetical protein